MDTLTTAVGGALLAKVLPEKYRGPSGAWTVALASAIPDIDVFADFVVNDPLGDLTQHRGLTHSLVGAAVMAPLLTMVFRRFSKDKNNRRLLSLVLLGLGWHMFTDLATSWGTMVFYPFSRDRVVWDLVFIIDFPFSAILLLPQLIAWIYRQPEGAGRRGGLTWAALTAFTALVINLVSLLLGAAFNWALFGVLSTLLAALVILPAAGAWGFRHNRAAFCRVGVAALLIYFGVCTAAHFRALHLVKEMARSRNLAVQTLGALPQPLSPFRWSGLVLTPEGVHQSWFNVLDRQPPRFQFYPSNENGFVAQARTLPEVQTYLWFARFPVARYRTETNRHIVEYTDLRFHMPTDRDPGFTFRITFNDRGEVLSRGFVER